MLLQDTIFPNGTVVRGAEPPLSPEALTEIVPRMAMPGIVAILLVVGMIWLVRKARQGLRPEPIQERAGATTAALLVALAQKERELTGIVAAGGPRRHVPTPTGGTVAAPESAGPRALGVYQGPVHCPACATQLGVSGPQLQYVTRCPACARWIASRIEGQRVIVEARLV